MLVQDIFISQIAKHRTHAVLIGRSLFDCSSWLPKKKFSQLVIITDSNIKKLYGLRLKKELCALGYLTLLLSFHAGEKSKNYKTKQNIERDMYKHHCDRDTLILALGGGVVGDIAGFIAATFLRGIAYVQIPTSLLAMVDSSIGGKTGINTRFGKNLIGSIYQPICVVVDISLLKTLFKPHLINGLIECIKMFLTHDAKSFYYIQAYLHSIIQGNKVTLNEVIVRAIRIKSAVVTQDEKDQAERNTLNFGHTIGHALEKLSNYNLLHGYAVAYGILVEATISHLSGLLDFDQLIIIKNLIVSLNIHGSDLKKYDFGKLIQATKIDKKVRFRKVNYVLLNQIGHVYVSQQQFVHGIDDRVVKQALEKVIEM